MWSPLNIHPSVVAMIGGVREYLEDLRRASLGMGIPAIDPEDGMILEATAFQASSAGASLAVDAGAGIGYSTAWIALGLEAGCRGECRLIAIEYDPGKARRIRESLEPLGLEKVRVEVVEGDALEYLARLPPGSLGYAFVDVEKSQYPAVLDLLSALQPGGGVALFHNAYFPPPPRAFYEKASAPPWRSLVIPTPAGMLIAIHE